MQRPPPFADAPKYPVTTAISVVCIALTIARWMGRDVSMLLVHSNTWPDAPWQLLNSIFFHGDVFHIAFNLYWFWIFGTMLEKAFGPLKFLGMVVIFAFGSSAAEYAFLDGGIGLSGVGYGLFGMVWMLSRHDARFATAIDKRTIQVFVAWFFLCIILTRMHVWQIANIAHGSGLLLGILLGESTRRAPRPALMRGLLVLALLLCGTSATVGREYVNLSGDAAEGIYHKGYLALEAGQNEEAVEWMQHSIRAGLTNRSDVYHNLGIGLQALGKPREAIAAYQRSLELNPNQPDLVQAIALLTWAPSTTASAPAK